MNERFSVGDRVVATTKFEPLMGKTGTVAYVDRSITGMMWIGVIFDEPGDLLHNLFRLGGEPLCEDHRGYWLMDDMISLLEDDVSDIEVGNIAELIGGFS